ncbi:MAG TPA: pyridoxamine 5'-phosphate oxidase family protein [Acidimicrobiales bacterium]|nr:pyridoxamine 5'-phosphate oxidase family protein [Acidimicrobiales bacterium]
MSVPVALEELRDQINRFGAYPYLVTVSDDGRPHTVGVDVAWDGDQLVAGAGRRTAANVTDRPLVTLLWPPYEADGYTLIVDGDAALLADAEEITVTPTRAVLHKPTAGPGMNCVTVL